MFLQCCFKVVVVKGKYVLVLLEHRVECFLNRLLSPLYNVVWLQKEEVETALRSSNMILEDALDLLNMSNNWRGRHNDLEPPFEHMNPPFPTQRFNPQQIPFAPPVSTEPPSRSLLSLSLSLCLPLSLSLLFGFGCLEVGFSLPLLWSWWFDVSFGFGVCTLSS